MSTPDLIICTIGMALGTALPRALPLTLLAGRPMPALIMRWLGFVPAAILAALVAPDLLLREGRLFLSPQNHFLIAAVPTLLVAWKCRSFFVILAVGMGIVAALRWWQG